MGIDLEAFLGRTCLLQFRNGDSVLMSQCERGIPAPLAVQTQEGVRPVITPFIRGEIVKAGCGFAVRIKDEAGAQLDFALNPDALLCVTTVHAEPGRIALALVQ